jgi:hypothetical protein
VCRLVASPCHPPRFVSSVGQLEDECLRNAKLHLCPHCKQSGTLIGHGFLRGYAERGTELVIRGRRLFCSDRFLQRGCGRTVAIWFDNLLPGHTVRATTLLDFAKAVVGGTSRRAAWQMASTKALGLTSGYRLWQRLSHAQSYLRTKLNSHDGRRRARTKVRNVWQRSSATTKGSAAESPSRRHHRARTTRCRVRLNAGHVSADCSTSTNGKRREGPRRVSGQYGQEYAQTCQCDSRRGWASFSGDTGVPSACASTIHTFSPAGAADVTTLLPPLRTRGSLSPTSCRWQKDRLTP